MGCVKSTLSTVASLNCCKKPSLEEISQLNSAEADEAVKTYSWDTRPKNLNHKIENETGTEVLREPGSIAGSQMVIQNCKGCRVYLLDHSAALNIDDCEDCLIVCGPVKGSIFLRDTTNTTLCSASGQLRLRDAQNIHLFVGSETEPIIEACQAIHIGPYPLSYDGINEDFALAGLSRERLLTQSIYDFTPPEGTEGEHWARMDTVDTTKYVPCPSSGPNYGFNVARYALKTD